MRRPIRLGVCDVGPGDEPENNYLVKLLRTRFDIQLCDDPDFLLYSFAGGKHLQYRCVRIFYTGENKRPQWDECDYAFTFEYSEHFHHYRWPLYAQYGDLNALVKKNNYDAERIIRGKTKFCNFMVTNGACEQRNRFFDLLSKYKRVDSGGKFRNNLGYRVGWGSKQEFIRDYKFTIAFENDSHPGYTTEKIAEPMWANSLPIYWGNPLVHLEFNPRSFVNYFDHGSLEALVERVIEIDRNDDLYLEYLREPWFHGNAPPQHLLPEAMLDQFERIFTTFITPVALRRPATLRRRARVQWRAAENWVKANVLRPLRRAIFPQPGADLKIQEVPSHPAQEHRRAA